MADADSTLALRKAAKAAYLKKWNQANKARLKVERADYHKAYRAANAAKIKAKRDANADRMRAYLAVYHKANRAKHLVTMREHYAAHAEAYKAKAREWKEKNPDRFKQMRKGAYVRNIEKNREAGRADWSKHNAKRKAAKAVYRAKFPEMGAHFCRLRQTRKQQATPKWSDLTAIKAIYKEAARRRKETGTEWHVDHEVPLKHPLVCGLHCEFNLRVIPGPENQSKGNGFVVE